MKYQRGFGALEVMICLIIGALATVAGARVYTSYLDRQVNRSAGEQMGIVADAAAKYIKDNYAAITAVATPAAPAVITTAMLRATGYLPAGFSDTNVYGQDYRILALEPTANKLQTLIVTVNGDVIREMHLLEISKLMGAKGGYISSTNTAVAFGSFGGWQTALAPYGVAPGAGHLATALFFDDGAMVTDYLYRSAVPGQPQLNRMNTSIDMGNNDLNNTDAVNANTVNANTANVSGNTSTAGETYTGGWFRGRGDGLIYNEKWNGGWYMADPQWMRSYADKGIYTGGAMLGGTLQSTGRTTVGEYLHVAGVATAGVGCAPNGLEARDSTGLPLYCQSGLWKTVGISGGSISFDGTYLGSMSNYNSTGKPMFVSAYGGYGSGGTCGNRYQMSASVYSVPLGGWIAVAGSSHTYDVGSKSESIGFMVPAGSTYTISSAPYACGAGVIHVSEFVF